MSESSQESVLAKRHQHKDCMGCRIVGGGGLIGMGIYMYLEGRKRPTLIGKNVVQGLALGVAALGAARVFELYPFNRSDFSE